MILHTALPPWRFNVEFGDIPNFNRCISTQTVVHLALNWQTYWGILDSNNAKRFSYVCAIQLLMAPLPNKWHAASLYAQWVYMKSGNFSYCHWKCLYRCIWCNLPHYILSDYSAIVHAVICACVMVEEIFPKCFKLDTKANLKDFSESALNEWTSSGTREK